MTKFVQWLTLGVLFVAVWCSLLLDLVPIKLSPQMHEVLLPLPVYLIICFGCYSLSVIGYRVMTFNDCENAATELSEDIKQARKDLRSKGMKF